MSVVQIQKKLININFTTGRAGKIPHIVVIHTTDGFGKNNFIWFNNPKAKSSSHFGVMLNGTIEQYVEIDNTAWHAGNWEINLISIGIEFDDNKNPQDSIRTKELYQSGIQLICYLIEELEKKYSNKFIASASQEFVDNFIRAHREFSPGRACPAGLDINRIKQGVLAWLKDRGERQNSTINIVNMQQQIEQLRRQINELNENVQNLLTVKNNLEIDISILLKQKIETEEKNEILEKEIKILEKKIEKLKKEIEKKENTVSSIDIEISKKKKQINDLNTQQQNIKTLIVIIFRFLKNLFFKKLK